jgi:uncharacterized membrane protein YfcA
MANELPANDMKNVWQCQTVEVTEMSVDQIRRRANRFRKGLRRQNFYGYILTAVLVGAFGWIALEFKPTNLIMRIGSWLVVLACLYIGYQIHTRGGRRMASADRAFADCLNFYRSELVRLRDFHEAVWSRFLAIILSYSVFCLGFATAHRQGAWLIGGIWLSALAFGLFGLWLQHWLGRRVQREIDALDASEKNSW